MNSFKEAFVQGIQEAEDAAENIAEIDAVLIELVNSISESSNGKIDVFTKDQVEIEDPDYVSRKLGISTIFKPTDRHYKALMATNSKHDDSPEYEICEWDVSDKGYPVNIRYSGHSSAYNDKVALQRGLSRLISTPTSGKIFKKLMEL